ncbi:hypothetical protein [Quadrisphaera setariae]|uniref:hypothetical protein n=1 Tax=Quadrisphaera setariae TaxID=2593304 RepID=UPI0016503A01|nr:hypothetical protein [Quadrisphaera setariae]
MSALTLSVGAGTAQPHPQEAWTAAFHHVDPLPPPPAREPVVGAAVPESPPAVSG